MNTNVAPGTRHEEHRGQHLLSARRLWIAAAAVLLIGAALVDVTVVHPRVHVRWREDVAPAERAILEGRYSLRSGERIEGTTWRYALLDRSRENVGALVGDPAVADTAYIDRPTLAVPDREVRVSADRARFVLGPAPSRLLQLQSLLLWGAGAVLLWAAGTGNARWPRALAIGTLLTVGLMAAYVVPLRQPIRMGDSVTYTQSRESFDLFSGVRQIRFEAHLSHAILGRLDAAFGRTADSPSRAMEVLMRAATLWFVASAVLVGMVERWSPTALRYLALCLLAPSTLLYFGYRELGHLSLNVATFPLLVRGLRTGSRHLELGGVLSGLGAALHGFGLLSVAGVWLATVGTRARLAQRARLVLRIAAWSAVAYLGWIAVYVVVLQLPLVPGHAESIPLRPWFSDAIGDRVNAAILTSGGARDLLFTFWVIGAPLLIGAAAAWRRNQDDIRAALLYAIPSAAFVVMFWPIQGLAVEMDLVFAAFPALYGLAWVCAQDTRRTLVAAGLLVSAHLAFWRIVLDSAFVNSPI